MNTEKTFLGTGWAFPPTFIKTKGGIDLCSDEEDVRQSLQILLTTSVGERVMETRYGCNLERLLFEPLNTTLRTYMEDLIKTAILYFEPRIHLNRVTLSPEPNNGLIEIEVIFTIKGTNSRSNFVYPFYQKEGVKAIP